MAESLSLSVGDRLVYPNQGLCTVTEIKNEAIAGQELVFVSLIILETGAKVKVPQDKLVKNGVRRVSTPEDVKAVFDFLTGESEKASLDWKKRARDNTARLSEGGLLGLAEVVKGLQVLSELRPLPPKEREQYNDARHLFVDELASALNIGGADAEDSLDIVLFPVGRDRPKRSIEEFQGLAGEDDEFGIVDDIALDTEEPAEPGESEEAEAPSANDDEEGEAPKPAAKIAAQSAKPPKAGKAAPKTVMNDFDVTTPAGSALQLPEELKKKRGRPPKPKPEVDLSAPPPPPKKRGRPPKPKVAEAAPPKKRGRPPKAK
jgi:CarD family transcriptional regulator